MEETSRTSVVFVSFPESSFAAFTRVVENARERVRRSARRCDDVSGRTAVTDEAKCKACIVICVYMKCVSTPRRPSFMCRSFRKGVSRKPRHNKRTSNLKMATKVDNEGAPVTCETPKCTVHAGASWAWRKRTTLERGRPRAVRHQPTRVTHLTRRLITRKCPFRANRSRRFMGPKPQRNTSARTVRMHRYRRENPHRLWHSFGLTRIGDTHGFRGTHGAGWS